MSKLKVFLRSAEKYIFKHKKYITAIAMNMTILFFISLILQFTGIFEVQRFIDLKLFAVAVVAITIVSLSSNLKDIFKSLLLLSLFILTANTVFNITILNIPDYILLCSIFILGFLALHEEKEIMNELENEKTTEQKKERERQNNFSERHPKMNKIPILNYLLRWMHKEGWWYCVGLLLLTVIGFGLRIYNLEYLSPLRDEYSHLIGAKRFMLEGTFNYSRASFLTYIVGILFKLNGDTSLFLGRLPSVIFGTLSIIAIYFLAKKINKKVGIISAYLFAFSPFAVGMSRFLREYQAFFLFLILYLLYLSHVVDNFKKTKLNLLKLSTLVKIVVLLSPVIYYISIEHAAVVLPLYLTSIIFILAPFIVDFLKSKNKADKILKNRLLLICGIFLLIIYIPTLLQDFRWLLSLEDIQKTTQYEDFLFKPDWGYKGSTPQWFSESKFSKSFAICLFVLPLLFFFKNKQYIGHLLSFSAIFITFLYFIDWYFAPRYIYYAFPFYITMYACSFYILLTFGKLFNKGKSIIYGLLITIVLISFFNPIVVINCLQNEKNGIADKKTIMIHRDTDQLRQYLKENNFSDKDVLITPNAGIFLYYYNIPFLKNESDLPYNKYKYSKTSKKFLYDYGYQVAPTNAVQVRSIVNKFDMGWIVIDKDRNRHWKKCLPLENIDVENQTVEYLGAVGGYRGFDIYRWNTSEQTRI